VIGASPLAITHCNRSDRTGHAGTAILHDYEVQALSRVSRA
jgi:hypothetical protein